MYYSNKSHFLNGLELHVEISDGSAGLITGLEYWNGILEWTTGLDFFGFTH